MTDHSAVLIGKTGAYIYNKTPFGTGITSFKIYSNKGASTKVSVGVYFSTETIESYQANSAQYTATLSKVDSVYDVSSKVPAGAKYFWYQVTNGNNSQIQFEITYSNSSEPSVSVENGSGITLEPGKTSQYPLTKLNLSTDATLEAVSENSSIAEVSLNEDGTALNVSAKALGETNYTVSAKDSTGSVVASFTGKITVQNLPTKISFGTASSSWNFNSALSTFEDADGNAWKGTVAGASYFAENASYSQIGSNNNSAESIGITCSLGTFYSIDSVSGVFNGNSDTAGNVSIKAGSMEIGKGDLNGNTEATIPSTSSAIANSISIEISNISKAVKLISLEYSVSVIPQSLFTEVNTFVATYITPYSGEAKEGETCKAKYEAASTAYSAMTEKARQLFDVHTDYAGAKVIFDYWYSSTSTDSKGAPLAAAKTSEIASVSSIGLFAVAGAVVLGLFFVNKKKAE